MKKERKRKSKWKYIQYVTDTYIIIYHIYIYTWTLLSGCQMDGNPGAKQPTKSTPPPAKPRSRNGGKSGTRDFPLRKNDVRVLSHGFLLLCFSFFFGNFEKFIFQTCFLRLEFFF